jgi:pyruvate/2-oxoglutarate dehydrogenase complex dihydrolipoamide acyltransferase (E2) component
MTVLRELNIPRMGSVENAKLVTWRVAEGANFAAGSVICDIETDKTLTEVEAEADGILAKRLAAEGDELKVGDLIGLLASPGATHDAIVAALQARDRGIAGSNSGHTGASPDRPAIESSAKAGSGVGVPGESGGAVKLSPLARRLAKEHGIDPASVRGTGPDGRITGDDVLEAAALSANPSSVTMAKSSEPAGPAGYENVPVLKEAHSTRRRAIARRLVESIRTAPQLTADMQVDVTALLAARERLNTGQDSSHVSVLSFIAHVTAQLLKRHPDLNAAFTETHALRWQVVNLGIAVDAPEGLVVPVVRNAETLSLHEMHASIAALASRARAGSLHGSELEGGTFTISNPGSLGPVLRAEAILNPPQVALLGIPGLVYAPLAIETVPGQHVVEARPILRPSLTFDHRALDGGHVIRFLNDLKSALEAL